MELVVHKQQLWCKIAIRTTPTTRCLQWSRIVCCIADSSSSCMTWSSLSVGSTQIFQVFNFQYRSNSLQLGKYLIEVINRCYTQNGNKYNDHRSTGDAARVQLLRMWMQCPKELVKTNLNEYLDSMKILTRPDPVLAPLRFNHVKAIAIIATIINLSFQFMIWTAIRARRRFSTLECA